MKIRAYKNLLEVFCYIINNPNIDWDLLFDTRFTNYILRDYDKEKQLLYFKSASGDSKVISLPELILVKKQFNIVGYLFCSIIGKEVNVILRDGYEFTHFNYSNNLSIGFGFQLSIEVQRVIVSGDLACKEARLVSFAEFLSMINKIESK